SSTPSTRASRWPGCSTSSATAPSNGTPRSSSPASADSWRSTPTARTSEPRTEIPDEEQGPKRKNAQPARTEQPSAAGLGGLQPYPSRTKDPDTVDFSTGSVGIGATAPIWAALSHRYVCDRFPETPRAGRFCSLLGDAEMDEGAVWEAIIDPGGAHARRDRVVRGSQPAVARSSHPRCADQAAPG